MGRNFKNIYLFIQDESGNFYTSRQNRNGDWIVESRREPMPISETPPEIETMKMEFRTNMKYMSCNRSISYPIKFVKDGAAILRHLYYNGRLTEERTFLTIVRWNGEKGYYELYYRARIDYHQKEDVPQTHFSVSTINDDAFSLLIDNDTVEYAIDCSKNNPLAVPVLFDGINLKNIYTVQLVECELPWLQVFPTAIQFWNLVPPTFLANQDGDSFGITIVDTVYNRNLFNAASGTYPQFDFENNNNVIFKTSRPITISVYGTVNYICGRLHNFPILNVLFIKKSNGEIINDTTVNLTTLQKASFDISFSATFDESDSMFMVFRTGSNITILPSNIYIENVSKPEPRVVYGLRPLDVLKQLASRATRNRFSADSNFLNQFNKRILFPGDAIRGLQQSSINTSFDEFFKAFNAMYFMALKTSDGKLFLEKAQTIYSGNGDILDLGEVTELRITPAIDMLFNKITVGSVDVDYRRSSGRLEFNTENTFTLPIRSVEKDMNIVSPYRLGCYGQTFLYMDYDENSTKDTDGDKSVWVAEITDNLAESVDRVENFVNVNFLSNGLQPYIRNINNFEVIRNRRPRISGVGNFNQSVNIYYNGILAGSTTANSVGFWTFDFPFDLEEYIPGVSTGEYLIQASYFGLGSPNDQRNILVSLTEVQPTVIISPTNLSFIYNNKPLLRGKAAVGTNLNVFINNVFYTATLPDGSCNFEVQLPVLPNGSNIIRVNSTQITINVNSFVEIPLITSFDRGFIEVNNLPRIEGVALPNTMVKVYIDYISDIELGSAMSDSNGNWGFDVVERFYNDSLTGQRVYIAPIKNGISVFSTSLEIKTASISTIGYELNRPDYTEITGVYDNTVFNTEMSPKRMLANHYPMIASVMLAAPFGSLNFQISKKNANFSTLLGTQRVIESSDVFTNELGEPLFIPEWVTMKTKVPKTFQRIIEEFNNGQLISFTYRGNRLYALPIGGMSVNGIMNDEQEFRLLLSPKTTYFDVLNLYKNGIKISIMKNTIYHSDLNSLHFVVYDFQKPEKYGTKTIYQDWFEERNDYWAANPKYIQKYQKTDIIKDQIITNGVSNIILNVHSCVDGSIYRQIDYTVANPAPIPPPDVVYEAEIDFSDFDEGEYFFVMKVNDTNICISERVEILEYHRNTILIESSNSINQTGVFYSTGFKTIIRVEGIIKKVQPDITTITAVDESGNSEMLYSLLKKTYQVRFGNGYGLPDYIYMKIASAVILDSLKIEGIDFCMMDGEKIEVSDDVNAHPLYYYSVKLLQKINEMGAVFKADEEASTDSIVLVVDPSAFGLSSGNLLNINIKNE